MSVKKNIDARFHSGIGAELRRLRKEVLRVDQRDFARLIGVSQASISEWENGDHKPPPMALMAIGKLGGADKGYWFRQAGQEYADVEEVVDAYKKSHPGWEAGLSAVGMRQVPLLKDSLAAGTPRAIDEREIDRVLLLPKDWFHPGGELYAVKVDGDSMAPIIDEGYTVIIDTSRRDEKKLINKMVAARDSDGVTIKWLRKDLGHYMLVPQNVSPRHPVRILSKEHGWGIVGEVVRWIGYPRPSRG